MNEHYTLWRINIITAFPNVINQYRSSHFLFNWIYHSFIRILNLKRIKSFDQRPIGVQGMCYRFDTIDLAFKTLNLIYSNYQPQINIHFTPRGISLDSSLIYLLIKWYECINLLCTWFEGVDARVNLKYIDLEISLGNYIISNGSLACNVFLDVLIRYLILKISTIDEESFFYDRIDYSIFTRPKKIDQYHIPSVLFSGHKKNINLWKIKSRLINTLMYQHQLIGSISTIEWWFIKWLIVWLKNILKYR